ncbi:hypothetical protein ILUMI_07391 [Ignelater luminosus]|uniref:Uncharacterized protein n=1 Tax=Ignelater luminosus TaxID=2038154 RepID=A0A8K0GBN4_IGNLU|nr:hypothetical protein ILUMI_07391 [Ignelater luminosus]
MKRCSGLGGSFVSLEYRSTETSNRFSTLSRLQRFVAYALRFKHNCWSPRNTKRKGFLLVIELEQALYCLVKLSQLESYPLELKRLSSNKPLHSKSKILSLKQAKKMLPLHFLKVVEITILTKDRKTRNPKFIKCYIALFICYVIKAIHLELVTEFTINVFRVP